MFAHLLEFLMCFFRYCLVIQTREALNEAYIKHGRDFSNRPRVYIDHLINPRMLGLSIDISFDRPTCYDFALQFFLLLIGLLFEEGGLL